MEGLCDTLFTFLYIQVIITQDYVVEQVET